MGKYEEVLEEVRGCKGKYEKVLEEGKGPKVQGFQGPRVPRTKISQTPFKYELDSKEGPSCSD